MAWLLPLLARGATDPALFPLLRPLDPPPQANRALGVVALDEVLFAAADPDCANLRILEREAPQETPFLVRMRMQSETVVREQPAEARLLNVRFLPDNRVEIVVERTRADGVPAALELVTAERNYEKQVSVDGGADREHWVALTSGQPLFDYTRYLDLRRTRIDFPPAAHRYYRVSISNLTEVETSPLTQIARETRGGAVERETESSTRVRRDFRIDAIRLIEQTREERSRRPLTRAYAAERLAVSQDPPRRETEVRFATRRAPVSRIALATDSANFSRRVRVEANDGDPDRDPWQSVGGGTLSRVTLGRHRHEQVYVDLGPDGVRRRWYRVVIENHDSPPLAITGVDLTGPVYEALFLCRPGAAYRLLYGGEGAARPVYDLGAVLATAADDAADEYRPGPEVPNPQYRRSRARGWRPGRAWFLGAVVAMVLALGWVIARVARQADTMPP